MIKNNRLSKKLGEKYLREGYLKDAVRMFEKAKKEDPWDPIPYGKLAVIYGDLFEVEKAKKYLDEFLKLPSSLEYPDVRKEVEYLLTLHPRKDSQWKTLLEQQLEEIEEARSNLE